MLNLLESHTPCSQKDIFCSPVKHKALLPDVSGSSVGKPQEMYLGLLWQPYSPLTPSFEVPWGLSL